MKINIIKGTMPLHVHSEDIVMFKQMILDSSKFGVYRGLHDFHFFCSITYIVGTRKNRPNEAVLTCTHNMCFGQKYENSQNISTGNCRFYSREKSLCIAWACFRNECTYFFR